ncbi:MAG: hypothetical protein ABSH56_07045 [Bryobacteraceae bacterium]
MGLNARQHVLVKIVGHSGHPAGLFHGTPGYPVVGIFFVLPRRIEGDDGVHLEHPENEDQAAAQVDTGDAVHVVVQVVEIEHILEPERRGHAPVVLLVAVDVLGVGVAAGSFIIGGAHDVTGVALSHQLGAQPRGVVRDVVTMGMHGGEDFALVGLPRLVLHDDGFPGIGLGRRGGRTRHFIVIVHCLSPEWAYSGIALASTYLRIDGS